MVRQRGSTALATLTSRTPCVPRCRRIVLDEELTMLIGAARDGSLLEVGVLGIDGDDPVVVHAMALRPKFHTFLG